MGRAEHGRAGQECLQSRTRQNKTEHNGARLLTGQRKGQKTEQDRDMSMGMGIGLGNGHWTRGGQGRE